MTRAAKIEAVCDVAGWALVFAATGVLFVFSPLLWLYNRLTLPREH